MENKISIVTISLFCLLSNRVISQTINWASLKTEEKHIANIHSGYEYGIVYGLGYGYHIKSKMPIVLNTEYSYPSGKIIFDDFKTKIGGQIRVFHIKEFHLSAKINGVFRRFENPLVCISNFGSDMTVAIGYYKPKYYVALETGFDKAIVTKFKHSSKYKEIYPKVKDGWYEPATGGNFYYGLQLGTSIKRVDITLKLGSILTQDFKTTPRIKYYGQIGINYRFTSKALN